MEARRAASRCGIFVNMNDDNNDDWAAVGVHVMCNDQVDWEYAQGLLLRGRKLMRALIPMVAALALLAYAVPSEAQVDGRRWIVQTSDGKLIGFTDDQDVDPPDAAFATFVLESVIRAATPPGATGEILPLGTWIAGVYTAPSGGGIVEHIDPTSAIGGVQEACKDMLDVFDVALAYIQENRLAWTDDARTKAVEGIHWQIVNSARVALNATRTHARRQKFCEESASWPDATNGNVREYVDAFSPSTVNLPTKDWSWVNPETDPFERRPVGTSISVFGTATNVESAPSSAKLIGRDWISDIP